MTDFVTSDSGIGTEPYARNDWSVRHDLVDAFNEAARRDTVADYEALSADPLAFAADLTVQHAERLAAGCNRKVIVLDDFRRQT